MPDIDTELFQMIALGLMALMLLVMLLVLNAVGKVSKTLREVASAPQGEHAGVATPQAQATAAPAEAHAPQITSYQGQPQAAPSYQQQQQPEAQPQTQPAPAVQSHAPAPSHAQPHADTQPIPAAWGGPPETAAPAPQPAVTHEPIPEEQPFERDGRWWYKRGAEMLVYDEATGQWQPAPSDNPLSRAASAGSGGGEQPLDTSAGFWKCASCGAVNGATASTCRMCFAAKP